MNCGSGCTACDSATVCRTCTGADDLFDGSAPGACVTSCTATGKYKVTKTGGINHDTCNNCGANCDVCSSSTVCDTCGSAYYLNSGACVACTTLSTNCLTCSSSACTSCDTGYVLDGGLCITD